MNDWRDVFRQLARYPSAVAGLTLILALAGLAIYSVISLPYQEALERWRGGDYWRFHPVNARPLWSAWLTGADLPETRIVESAAAPVESALQGGVRRLRIPLAFDYAHTAFPSEIAVFLATRGGERQAFARLTWETPDGRRIPLGGRQIAGLERVALSQDWTLEQRLGRVAHLGLLAAPAAGPDSDSESEPAAAATQPTVLPGRYRLTIDAILFDPATELDAQLVVYGRIHGWAGTDHRRRDLMDALLWGTPVALAFGLLAALGTTFATLVIAAAGVWFGGWVDALIQRLTEINMILPLLPILVMVGTLYSTGIWAMLGVVIAFGILGAGIKMYRAMLLPIRHAPYIEAARAYGASDWRIILRYLIPRILPVLIPTFVTLIPSFVFLEASLALLGLGDPVLPTWGKVLNDAQAQGALYNGHYYWVLEPALLLMLTGLGFAMLGFALDRVFNPRLRNL